MKESGYSKSVRAGENGFKHGRGSEDALTGHRMPGFGESSNPARSNRSLGLGSANKLEAAHGYGHSGRRIVGVLRHSGSPKAHRVGIRKK